MLLWWLLLFAPAKLQSVSIFLTRHASTAGCVKNIKLETVGLSNYHLDVFFI